VLNDAGHEGGHLRFIGIKPRQSLQQIKGQFLFQVSPIVFRESFFADQLAGFVANEWVGIAIETDIRIL
jgi:hypothetical protein